MDIDNILIEQLAEIAAIELSPEDVVSHRKELGQLVGFVSEKLEEINTDDMPEMVLPFEAAYLPREDVVTSEDMKEKLIAGAPDKKGNYIKVPRTFEE